MATRFPLGRKPNPIFLVLRFENQMSNSIVRPRSVDHLWYCVSGFCTGVSVSGKGVGEGDRGSALGGRVICVVVRRAIAADCE